MFPPEAPVLCHPSEEILLVGFWPVPVSRFDHLLQQWCPPGLFGPIREGRCDHPPMCFDLGVDLSWLWTLLDDSLVSIRIISKFSSCDHVLGAWLQSSGPEHQAAWRRLTFPFNVFISNSDLLISPKSLITCPDGQIILLFFVASKKTKLYHHFGPGQFVFQNDSVEPK